MTKAPNNIKSICVFCASSRGARPEYLAAAKALGSVLAEQSITLIYGGASVGLMGAVADAALAGGTKVVGVIPQHLVNLEVAHHGLSELIVVDSMHTRKQRMAELADAFIALPGGFGTLEEVFEIATWAQLGLHHKPCGFLDVAGYYQHLMAFLDHAANEQLLRHENRQMLLYGTSPLALVEQLRQYQAPHVPKFLTPEQS